ncbi:MULTISPECIES: tetratricopeptide repeat protein [Bradyrhizobium]|uniref:protein O-GlcNAc transferase n=2 Tax=Bradyrhizobium TaxID=374 RepID=A0ABY0QE85_9BRAD|nr:MULTISPECIES: tetratricopeptide repeat protein [Bradyrhizobium]SDK04351.1 Predicted O-linked N-acetylglucosamine transferase, SPINDLY family [Bradyrhizobium ottawaense]SEB85741.1 Predicted O-linked N-acetylglucosamine transferase, SPINDLY family [Bradyrhizobium lablabi]SHM58859.1 Predicted O-linked N-acetylglucosamine transferase, SPINDLY family [Bradyrhizobium lablabi]
MTAASEKAFRRGLAAFQSGSLDEAEKVFRRLLREHPGHPHIVGILGTVLAAAKKYGDAEPLLRAALAINPNSHTILYNYGLVLKGLQRPNDALGCFSRCIAISPNDAETFNNRGTVRNDLRDYAGAIVDFDRAIALQPGYSAALGNKGKSLMELGRHEDALAAYDAAIKLKPDVLESWLGRGDVLHKLKLHREAANAFARAMELQPRYPFIKGILLHQKLLGCDWKDVGESIADIERDMLAGRLAAEPFGWQGIASTARSNLLCARLYNREKYPAKPGRAPVAAASADGKIRVGYLAGEFRDQATSHLLAGVLEHHDRSRFEIHAFDNGWDDSSETRRRIEAAVHAIVGIRQLDDERAAAAVRERQIDILVNLNGYFGEDRTNVFAQRPAPIQVNYLGFPGTMGASYMDYIVADRRVIPEADRSCYEEKVVYLPNCYQANDRKRRIADTVFSREALGLPKDGFVFCCFNNNYKIMPAMFDCWMRILKRVPDSVLWLLADNAEAKANLCKEAAARGLDQARIVFADRMQVADHLARHSCADLFLDTLPYNAHTTGSDALWAGLPILTCVGESFAGRVAASLLDNVGLPELITTSYLDYEERAVEFATHPERLAGLRQRLIANRLTATLFDTELFTKHLEQAYVMMHARRQAAQAPDHIAVPG